MLMSAGVRRRRREAEAVVSTNRLADVAAVIVAEMTEKQRRRLMASAATERTTLRRPLPARPPQAVNLVVNHPLARMLRPVSILDIHHCGDIHHLACHTGLAIPGHHRMECTPIHIRITCHHQAMHRILVHMVPGHRYMVVRHMPLSNQTVHHRCLLIQASTAFRFISAMCPRSSGHKTWQRHLFRSHKAGWSPWMFFVTPRGGQREKPSLCSAAWLMR